MFKNPETGTWEHDFRAAGMPRYRISYGRVKKADAERLHAVASAAYKSRDVALIQAMQAGIVNIEQLAQLRERGLPFANALASVLPVMEPETPTTPWPTLREAVEEYVKALSDNTNKSDGTTRTAKSQLQSALEYFGPDVRLDAITTKMLTGYQSDLMARGRAVNTVTSRVWRVATMYRWFIRQETTEARETGRPARVLYVPLDSEQISTKKERRKRYLSAAEAAQLLEVTPRPMRFPVAAGLYAGLRVDEMCHLRPAFDIDWTQGKLLIQEQGAWKPKTAKSARTVPIGRALRPILEYHVAHFSSEEWVTPSYRDPTLPLNRHSFDPYFAKIVDKAELVSGRKVAEGVTYHTLRHTFASHLLMNGADLFTVSQLLGNSVKQVEDTYGHLSQDHRQMAVDRLATTFGTPHGAR